VLSLATRGIRSIFNYNSNRRPKKYRRLPLKRGVKAVAVQLDTGDTSAFDGFVKRVREILGGFGVERCDYLVNNAGIYHHSAFDQTTETELDSLYRVHFKGVFFLTQKLLPLIKDGGRIVNLSTGLTRFTIPGSAPYASMKWSSRTGPRKPERTSHLALSRG
jgi:NAD(P)-dependent dehydrogenase (short-subunit alcohol dehydrogenase family)